MIMADISIKQNIDGNVNDLEFIILRGTSNAVMHTRRRTYYKTIRGVKIPKEKQRLPYDPPSSCDTDLSHYHDVIDIPATVFKNGVDYTIVGMENELMMQGIAVTQVSIPGTVERISDRAFFHCINLQKVTLSEGLKSIGSNAFCGCPNIHDIVVPDSVMQMGDAVFLKCQNLTTVTLGEQMRVIGGVVFRDCPNITAVTCKAEIPPTFMFLDNAFTPEVYEHAVLKVPQQSIDKYRNAPIWSLFKNIEPMYVGRGPNDHPQWTKNDIIGD